MLTRCTARRLRCAAAAAALLAATAAYGGTASATFTVQINLFPPGAQVPGSDARAPGASPNASYCVSAALSEQTNAQVRVVCNTGEFVSIEPVANQAFTGTHGGAWRFALGTREDAQPATWSIARGSNAATVTRLQLFDVVQRADTLEMLVSF